MASRDAIIAPDAPPAVGPYSHAVRAGGLLFCSGQIPLDPATGELVGDSAVAQAERCLANLQAVCAAAGTTLARAVRLTVYMTDLSEFAAVNEVYAEFFAGGEGSGVGEDEGGSGSGGKKEGGGPPARVTVGVAALPKGAQVEVDAVVAL